MRIKMNIDFTPITSSPQFEIDRIKLSTTGNKRASQIWMIIAMIFIRNLRSHPYICYSLSYVSKFIL